MSDVETIVNDPLVTICAECERAGCWYGEVMCNEARTADVKQVRRSELAKTSREHPRYWSDESLENGGTYARPMPYFSASRAMD